VAQSYFASVGKTTDRFTGPRIENYTVKFRVPQYALEMGQVYNVSEGMIDMIWMAASPVRDYEWVFGDEQFLAAVEPYMLPGLLASHGRPTEVFLRAHSSVPEGGWLPYQLLLFYPEQGIMAQYFGPAEQQGENLRICPWQADITLWLWPPNQEMTLEGIAQVGPEFPAEEIARFRSLQKVTGMSVEQFYQTFMQSSNVVCLDTPASMWP
jgi:hypothetical protein